MSLATPTRSIHAGLKGFVFKQNHMHTYCNVHTHTYCTAAGHGNQLSLWCVADIKRQFEVCVGTFVVIFAFSISICMSAYIVQKT